MKKIKIKYYQKFADFIVSKAEKAKSDKQFNHWFNIGLNFNEYCVMNGIYLD